MRSVKFLIAAGAATLLSTAASAADMPSIMAPPPMQAGYAAPPADDFGGWYLRGDVGMTSSSAKLHTVLYDGLAPGTSWQQLGHGFSGGTSFGIGAGYKFNSWFRADITGEYRSKVKFNGTDFFTFPNGGGSLADTYDGGYKSWVALINGYVDLGTWWCLTPFVGAGFGFANVQTTGISDIGTLNNGAMTSYFANGASKTNFAWAAHAGVGYKVTNSLTIELAYRYLDMGTAVHGFGRSFTGNISGPSTFQYRDLTSQDVRLGVRWTCCDVPPAVAPAVVAAPPPLIRKG